MQKAILKRKKKVEKEEIDWDLVEQFILGLEDLKHGRIKRVA